MKLVLQIAAGVLLAKLIWWIGELMIAAAAVSAAEASFKQAFKSMNQPPSTSSPSLVVAPSPPSPPARQVPALPRYPFPSNDLAVSALACMNGIIVRHETNGWTQVGGSTSRPACAKSE